MTTTNTSDPTTDSSSSSAASPHHNQHQHNKRTMKTFLNQPSLDIEFGLRRENSGLSNSSRHGGSPSSVERRTLIGNNSSNKDEENHTEAVTQMEKSLPFSIKKFAALFKEASAVFIYSFCSVSMILVNKSLASSYNHLIEKPADVGGKADLNTLLVVFQAAAAVVFCWGSKMAKFIDYPELQWSIVKSWAPVNIFFCLMLFTSMAALQTNSVPLVTVFKNVSAICTAIADYFIFGNKQEPLSIAAFAVMFMGAVFLAWDNAETSWVGMFWLIFNIIASSGYVCYMKYATQSVKMSKFGMVYINNVLCVAFLLPVAFVNGELALFARSNALHTVDYGIKNFFAGFVGFFLNFASLNCVSVNGATTYATVGTLNKVPVIFLGWWIFGAQLTAENWFFIWVSILGGFLYTWAKLRAKAEEKKQLDEANNHKKPEPNNAGK